MLIRFTFQNHNRLKTRALDYFIKKHSKYLKIKISPILATELSVA